jgi:hypothetical protein
MESDLTEKNVTSITTESGTTIGKDDVIKASPYFVVTAEDAIDAYKETPFNTLYYYPIGEQNVYVAGYYPAAAFEDVVEDYKGQQLEWVDDNASTGAVDVQVSTNTLIGTKDKRFDGETMKFAHILSKITFKAKLDENMYKYVGNVRITVSAEDNPMMRGIYASYTNRKEQVYQPYAWKHTENETAESETAKLPEWKSPETDALLSQVNDLEVGVLYIMPSQSSLKNIHLSYSISDTGDFTTEGAYTEYEQTLDEEAFTDADGKNLAKLKAGDAYEIKLIFYQSEIKLTGVPVEWENGGTVTVSVYPYPSVTDKSAI